VDFVLCVVYVGLVLATVRLEQVRLHRPTHHMVYQYDILYSMQITELLYVLEH